MFHSFVSRWCVVAAAVAASGAFCQDERVKPPSPLSPVPFQRVSIRDAFWAPKIETNRRVTVEACLEKCAQTGRIANFARAGGREKGPHAGQRYNDSDVYKVIEGVAYTLAVLPDEALERRADEVIDRVASAQEKDGYLNTYFTLERPLDRWKDMRHGHELYCAGHLIEAAVAYEAATGKRKLLDVAIRFADLIAREFGPGRCLDPCGHPEIELALVKLSRRTGEERYARLAGFFLDQRGPREGRTPFGEYAQDHLPVRDQSEVVGHAVRAMYMYCGMADVAALTGDPGLMAALERLWHDVIDRKMYVTGGIGASASNEGFTRPYDLPNESAYCETCASIGMALWNHRMFLLTGEGRFADVLEREVYNGVLSGVSLRGDRFFYDNPLASRGDHHRVPWFDCSCCPTNLVRFLPAMGERAYATRGDTVFIVLYIAGETTTLLPSGRVRVVQETEYPWSGDVRVVLFPEKPAAFELRLRVPGWCVRPPAVRVNGEPVDAPVADGFLSLSREWRSGDQVDLSLPMGPRRIHADPRVQADAGKVALQWGPVVYCVEGEDHGGSARNLALSPEAEIEAAREPFEGAGSVVVLRAEGLAVDRAEGKRVARPARLRAVPYHLWDNRAGGEMAVWIPESADRTEVPGEGATLFQNGARLSASHCHRGDTLLAMGDGTIPRSSSDPDLPRMTFWDHKGTAEWVEMEFEVPRRVSRVAVYWFDDTGRGECRVPASWRVLYRAEGEWKAALPLAGRPYGTALDRMNAVEFAPVGALQLRLDVQLQPGASAGILEWTVE